MNWLKVARLALKVIFAVPAIVEAGKAGVAAGRSILDSIKPGVAK